MAVKLKDVAKKARVSYTAASYVLNSKNLNMVSREKQKRVLQAIEDLDYRPHAAARSLRQKKFGNIGMFFGNSSLHAFKTSSDFIVGMNERLVEHGYNLLFHLDKFVDGAEKDLPRILYEQSIDGMIVVNDVDAKTIERVKRMGIPAIYANCNYWDNIDCIKPDDMGGISCATKHLIKLGHKKVLYVKPDSEHPSVVDRYNGYLKAMEEAGLESMAPLIVSTHESREDYRKYSPVVAGHNAPTALVSNSLGNVIMAKQALVELGLKVGEDVSLIGGDGGTHITPFIDHLYIPFLEMGIRAAELLLKKIGDSQPLLSEVVSERLVLCGSSSPPKKAQ